MSTPSPKERLATPIAARKPETHTDDDLERAIAEAWARVDEWLSRPRDQAEARR